MYGDIGPDVRGHWAVTRGNENEGDEGGCEDANERRKRNGKSDGKVTETL